MSTRSNAKRMSAITLRTTVSVEWNGKLYMPTAIQAAISLNSDSRVVAEKSLAQLDLKLARKTLRRPNQDLSFLKRGVT